VTPPAASSALTLGFVVLGLALALVAVTGIGVAAGRAGMPAARRWRWTFRAAALSVLWMGLWWRLAASGVLADLDRRPPPFVLMLVSVFGVSIVVAASPVGRILAGSLPLAALVFLQAFRFPLELLMHRAYAEGVMPVQMSYAGQNFDIVSGLTAIPVAWLLARGAPRAIAVAWNVLGILLLVNILVIAIRSTPIVAAYGPDHLNTWVAYPPFVWLPTVMVFTAITGHLVLTRVWAGRARPSAEGSSPGAGRR